MHVNLSKCIEEKIDRNKYVDLKKEISTLKATVSKIEAAEKKGEHKNHLKSVMRNGAGLIESLVLNSQQVCNRMIVYHEEDDDCN